MSETTITPTGPIDGVDVANIEFVEIAPSLAQQGAFACIGRYYNGSNWQSWLFYTEDDGATWDWEAVGGESVSGNSITGSGTADSVPSISGAAYNGNIVGGDRANSIALLTDSLFIHVYDVGSQDFSVALGAISGTTVSYGSEEQVPVLHDFGNSLTYCKVWRLAENEFLLTFVGSWYDAGMVERHGLGFIHGTQSSGIITWSQEQLVFDHGTALGLGAISHHVAVLDSDRVVINYAYDAQQYTHCNVVDGSAGWGALATIGSQQTISDSPASSSPSTNISSEAIDSSTIIFLNRHGDKATIGTVSGTTLSFGTTFDLGRIWRDLAVINSDKVLLIGEGPSENYDLLYGAHLSISGTSLAYGGLPTELADFSASYTVWERFYHVRKIALDRAIISILVEDDVSSDLDIISAIVTTGGSEPSIGAFSTIFGGTSGAVDYLYPGAYPVSTSTFLVTSTDNVNSETWTRLVSTDIVVSGGATKALGLSLSGALAYITGWDGSNLTVYEYDLTTLSLSSSADLGACTEGELNAGTYVAYPFVGPGGRLYIFGRMQDPQSLGDPAHVINVYASVWGATEIGWGTDSCGALFVEADGTVTAIRNVSGGNVKLYRGSASALSLRGTLTIPGVLPRAIDIDPYNGDIFLGADAGGSVMVIRVRADYGPENIYNLTFDHQTSDPVTSVVLL